MKIRLKSILKTSKKAGMPPGSLVHVGEKRAEKVKISLIDYDKDNLEEKQLEDIAECIPLKGSPTVTWVNVDGLHNIKIIEKLGQCFDLHPLVLEDILNTRQRPKTEEYEGYIFITLKMLSYNEEQNKIESEQVSLILSKHYVLSFQEREGDLFDPIRNRIREKGSKVREYGPDYLVYRLIDVVVDYYFYIIEKIGEDLEDLEEDILNEPTNELLSVIQQKKRELIMLRRAIYPLREGINQLERDDVNLISKRTKQYMRDVYDHAIEVIDTLESYRDMVAGLRDTYVSVVSNEMNRVMQTLTIIATIFIPLTFIAGIYGMNFENMPELGWEWGYAFAWGLFILMAIAMIIFFKRKKWM